MAALAPPAQFIADLTVVAVAAQKFFPKAEVHRDETGKAVVQCHADAPRRKYTAAAAVRNLATGHQLFHAVREFDLPPEVTAILDRQQAAYKEQADVQARIDALAARKRKLPEQAEEIAAALTIKDLGAHPNGGHLMDVIKDAINAGKNDLAALVGQITADNPEELG